ncbi:hypothetical protein [Montanilutibacter psychrotolerans]|uniref:Uncharacterized protein n=1 Tax=Montanilutibacter psychrotolerans TaxID=1327343 RepID=A0A3M8STU5_9GAMM|nr:hypothetical protein [Lysobacter psychrotolerans]RNF84213.1 hypothetical protein EER27_07405 [Lysobacter psychrotolerans]
MSIPNPAQRHALLALANGEVTINLSELEQIKSALIAKLRSRPENADFAALAVEAASANCFIAEDGIANIGPWTLEVRSGEAVLVRSSPRRPVMMIPVAYLELSESIWIVRDVVISSLHIR